MQTSDNRNGLLLAKGIEVAFDQLQLSFIKAGLLDDRLMLKIWDHSIRRAPIFEGSTLLIGSYEGHPLNLGAHLPFRRVLFYQAFMAYHTFKYRVGPPDIVAPVQCGSCVMCCRVAICGPHNS